MGSVFMSGRVWLGLLFLLFGLGFLMHQADILDFKQVLSTWWPLIVIIIGIVQLVNRTYSSPVTGWLFILVGALFLANQWVAMNLAAFIWPLLLIFIGLVIIFTKKDREQTAHTGSDLSSFALFSGAEIKSQSQAFEGGAVTTVCGGAEIDLREAKLAEKGATGDLTAVFGGTSLIVPEDMHVEVSGIPIFGGWEDKTRTKKSDEQLATLKLNCLAVFGGVEIKN